MQMADEAWKEVDTTTIRNCWRKAGILPDLTSTLSHTTQPSIPISSLVHDTSSQMDLIVKAERQVQIALDDLVKTGALQTQNRMDINALLNPDGESQVLTETSDKEIYHAVMDSIKARKNIDINGGDDVDNDFPMEPHPTCHEVLRVLSTIGKCIEASNDPIACKLDALMGTFSRQLRLNKTQSMRPTLVTDFFQKS
jgi:hypothetical protein